MTTDTATDTDTTAAEFFGIRDAVLEARGDIRALCALAAKHGGIDLRNRHRPWGVEKFLSSLTEGTGGRYRGGCAMVFNRLGREAFSALFEGEFALDRGLPPAGRHGNGDVVTTVDPLTGEARRWRMTGRSVYRSGDTPEWQLLP